MEMEQNSKIRFRFSFQTNAFSKHVTKAISVSWGGGDCAVGPDAPAGGDLYGCLGASPGPPTPQSRRWLVPALLGPGWGGGRGLSSLLAATPSVCHRGNDSGTQRKLGWNSHQYLSPSQVR